jgi:predicted ATP-grasp superfamily ATP-dependent carboligase
MKRLKNSTTASECTNTQSARDVTSTRIAAIVRSVLLIEEGWHSTLPLAATLETGGFAVTVLTANGTTARCRRRSVRWISGPTIGDAAFVEHVDRLVTAERYDHVLPLTEDAMARLWDASMAWSERIHPRTEPWQRALLRDKHALVEHVAARGIDVPRQVSIDVDPRSVPLPAVVKAAVGSGGRMVRIADSPAELADALARARALGGSWVVQEYLPGATYLFGGLFDDGRPLRMYAAEKLEQHPPRTGGAIRLRSTADAALLDAGTRVMRELRWTGFASADFMRRGDRYVFLEVNPRLWGSLAGARSADVELFEPFAELLAGSSPRADLSFAPDVECWIFPRYLNAARHRTLAGARRALRDLRGDQGREFRDPIFLVHILRRLYWMKRHAVRF